MRRMLPIMCALVIAGSLNAGALPSKTYLGIYADAAHSVTSLNPPLYSPFSVTFWVLPSERGFQGMIYKGTVSSNVIVTSTYANPQLAVMLGCIPFGCSGACAILPEGSCQMDWFWTHTLTCMVLDAQPGFIEAGPMSCESVLMAANCQPGYPSEPVTILDKFGIYQEAVLEIEPQPWGAIKSLYR